jgi:hypothetical protein
MDDTSEKNKRLVLEAFNTLFQQTVIMTRRRGFGLLTISSTARISGRPGGSLQSHQEHPADAQV